MEDIKHFKVAAIIIEMMNENCSEKDIANYLKLVYKEPVPKLDMNFDDRMGGQFSQEEIEDKGWK